MKDIIQFPKMKESKGLKTTGRPFWDIPGDLVKNPNIVCEIEDGRKTKS